MKNLRGVYIIWFRDVLRFWHDRMRLISSVTYPLLYLFVFGSGLSTRMGSLSPGVDFIRFIFPGTIGMTVLMSSFMAGVSLVWDREFGFLKEVLVAPISRAAVAVGKVLAQQPSPFFRGLHPIIRPFDWYFRFHRDSAGAITADVSARCFHRLSGHIARYAYQVDGGVSGGDADVDVSYDVLIWGLLSPSRNTRMA